MRLILQSGGVMHRGPSCLRRYLARVATNWKSEAERVEEKHSFWSSVPGILTGVAAILTATGGLLLALYQTGVLTTTDTEVVTRTEEDGKDGKAQYDPAIEAATQGGSVTATDIEADDDSNADATKPGAYGSGQVTAPTGTQQINPLSPPSVVNLISPQQGGKLLAANLPSWAETIDGKEIEIGNLGRPYEEEEVAAVFGFKDGKSAVFDRFTMFIKRTDVTNIQEFELLAGDGGPAGTFVPIGTFRTQNIHLFETPYQAFSFPAVTARNLKVKILSTYDYPFARAYEFQLYGRLVE